jgi:hypothetical protein
MNPLSLSMRPSMTVDPDKEQTIVEVIIVVF